MTIEHTWKDAARHWYESTNRERASLARERLKNHELLQKLENAANATQGFYDDLNILSERHRQERVKNAELLQKIEELSAELREKGGQVFRLTQKLDEYERAHLRSPDLLPTQKEPQPSGDLKEVAGQRVASLERESCNCVHAKWPSLAELSPCRFCQTEQPSGNAGDFAETAKERDELLRKWKEFEASPSIEDSATLNGYQRAAQRTCPASAGYVMPALGLTGEAGEYADEIKKVVFHGKPVDERRLAKELGDVLWYVAIAADSIGMKLSEVAAMNVEKLRARYPNGFSAEASAARVDEVVK